MKRATKKSSKRGARRRKTLPARSSWTKATSAAPLPGTAEVGSPSDPDPAPASEPDLLPKHRALIEASAISPEVMRARGYRTVTSKAELRRLGFSDTQCRVPALLVPVCGVTGEIVSYQIRPDQPRIAGGKPLKYETPKGSRMALDVPSAARPWLGDPARPLFITEGARKADAGVSIGLCTIALLGVWNWRGTNGLGGKMALPDWEMVALNGRDVYVVFDSDVVAKPAVRAALVRLKAFLEQRGAKVKVLGLPSGEGGTKVGLDDFLASGKTKDDLLACAVSEDRQPEGEQESTASDAEDSKGNQASVIVALAEREIVELFHDVRHEPYATILIRKHKETHRIKDRNFRRWLSRLAYKELRKAVSGNTLTDACNVLESKAVFDGLQRDVHVRVAEEEGAIYFDLGRRDRAVVKVTRTGIEIIHDAPARFRTPPGFHELPLPVMGGQIGSLRPFVNCTDADWPLILAWLVAALRPKGPYPVLVLLGEQGSAKSTIGRVLRALVDPNAAPLRSEPRDVRDLMIAASNCRALAFDNLGSIPPWLSDAICRLATGGGFATRTLYTDEEETIFDVQRPVIVTGIEDIVSRSDLLDRSILSYAPRIPEEKRRVEREFWAEFEQERPQILGALLNAVSVGLSRVDEVDLDCAPRMADFAQWAIACEPALGLEPGEFLEAYEGNREAAVDLAIESSPVAQTVRSFLEKNPAGVDTTAGRLLEIFNLEIGERRPRAWPQTPRGLSGALRRAAPDLRSVGVEVSFYRKPHSRERMIQIRPAPVATSHQTPFDGDGRGTVRGDGSGQPSPGEPSAEPQRAVVGDGGDGRDGQDQAPLRGRGVSNSSSVPGGRPGGGVGEPEDHRRTGDKKVGAQSSPSSPPSPDGRGGWSESTDGGTPQRAVPAPGEREDEAEREAREERAPIGEQEAGVPRGETESQAGLFHEPAPLHDPEASGAVGGKEGRWGEL